MDSKRSVIAVFILAAMFSKAQNTIVVHTDSGKEKISRHIYGHFSEHLGHCIYGGYWVGEDSGIANTNGIRNDVVDALLDLGIPNLRWPGGCFADEYHWMDGIGPRDQRPTMINTHWGGVTEDNSFGTHEFMELCRQLEAEPVICGNLGSGTVQEMSQWVEYLNSSNISPMTDLRKSNGQDDPWGVKYWNLGNENWGCGGNMTPSYYIFKMYKVHHDATLLPVDLKTVDYRYEDKSIPALSASASRSEDGSIHLTISNLNPHKQVTLTCELRGMEDVSFERGEILTAPEINAYNDFGKDEVVFPGKFDDIERDGNMLTVHMPAKSVVLLELKQR